MKPPWSGNIFMINSCGNIFIINLISLIAAWILICYARFYKSFQGFMHAGCVDKSTGRKLFMVFTCYPLIP